MENQCESPVSLRQASDTFDEQGEVRDIFFNSDDDEEIEMTELEMEMDERIRQASENGEYCLGIVVDLRRLFYTVDHSILMSKLEHLGV